MTDKELIKQEIERRINEYKNWIGHQTDSNYLELKELIQFIDSIPEEPASEDLEEYYKKEFLPKEWFAKPGYRTISQFNFFTAQHFAEWQKQKDMEDSLKSDMTMPNKFYEKGRLDMRDEMMKDAVDAFVNTYENTDDGNYVEFVTEQSPYKFKETEKCKIIIVMED